LLVKAGFSRINLDTILYCGDDSDSSNSDDDLYYDVKTWGKRKDENFCRLPLQTAAARSLTWVDTGRIFAVNMPAVHKVDRITGLSVFMLAAVGPTSDIESVYHLLKEYPPAIDSINNSR